MRFLCIGALLMFVSVFALAQDANSARDRKVIAAAKAVPVSKLDSKLPAMRFERWLKLVAGEGARITYEVNDCGEQTGTPANDRDFPMCVEAMAESRDQRVIVVSIAVGTFRRGAVGEPVVSSASIGCDRYASEPLKNLSDLPLGRPGGRKLCPAPNLPSKDARRG
jgi:hypothetical protein